MCAAKSGSYSGYVSVSHVEEKQAPCIGIGTRNINNKSRCKKSEEEIRAPIGLSNFKPKLASLSLATDQKCEDPFYQGRLVFRSCSAEIIGVSGGRDDGIVNLPRSKTCEDVAGFNLDSISYFL
ncbi:hypothetical protein HZH66_011918 [Vespula vulgaris]|uniref:Uncharacterized protein n=1 Tax=Vespula vulgaris TaxID=7454 RepID=A0A834JBC5_VESVU|nr:hypothetical protein HZH66_011918 [Vespula vulgaris]